MKFLTDEKRIVALRIGVPVFFIVGILMSYKLWHSDRLFPLLPVIDGFPVLPTSIDSFLPILLIAGLAVGIFLRKRVFFIGLLALLLFLLLQDQMRWQPWVYLYFCMLIPFAVAQTYTKSLLPFFQILIIGVYFWSGIYKIGPGFMEETFDNMLRELLSIENPDTRERFHFLGYLIPLIEVLIAIGLIFRKTRFISILAAIASHLIILTYLIKADHNSIVYPWNLAMIFFVIILFFKSENTLNFAKIPEIHSKILVRLAILFYILLPSLASIGLWDKYLSFKLYSGNNGTYMIALDMTEVRKINRSLHPYLWEVDEPQGKYWIYLSKWSIEELNVPFYPEIRMLKQIGSTYCKSDISPENLEFIQFNNGFKREGAVVFGCEACR